MVAPRARHVFAALGTTVLRWGKGVATPAPVAEFVGAPLSGTVPMAVTMTDQSTGSITSRSWVVRRDGVVSHSSAATNPTFALTVAGSYSFELTVTGPGGSNTRTRSAYVSALAAAPLTLLFDRATPHQIAVRADQTRALATGSTARIYYKLAASATWIDAGSLHRVLQAQVSEPITEGFAGFVLGLTPGAVYDVRVDLTEPGQPLASVSAQHTTRALPAEGVAQTKTATPATFAATMAGAVAGDVIVLQAGTYTLSGFGFTSPGTVSQPVYIRGQSRTGVILEDTTDAVVLLAGSHCIFENLTIRGSRVDGGGAAPSRGVVMATGRPQNITLRRITFDGLDRAVKGFVPVDGLLVYDCEFLGNNTWSQVASSDATGDLFNDDAVGMPGQGNCLWNCTIQGHGDVVKLTTGSGNTERSRACFAHSNWVRWSGDDFFEADDVGGNCAAYDNIVCNTTTAMSAADTFGGPVALIRNVFVNQARHPFKLNGTSQGVRILSNTVVGTTKITTDQDNGIRVPSSTNHALDMRNNLVTYRGAGGLIKWGGSLPGAVTDYNGWFPSNRLIEFGSGAGSYASLAAAKAGMAPRMANDVAIEVDPFLTDITLGATFATQYTGSADATLSAGSAARGVGVAIPGVTDGFTGAAPDLGAVITGRPAVAVGCSWNTPSPAWRPAVDSVATVGYAYGAHPGALPATLAEIDPTLQAWNPNNPAKGPWNGVAPAQIREWTSALDFCGAAIVPSLRKILYRGAGHAAVCVPGVMAFDIATRAFEWLDYPPPSDGLSKAGGQALAADLATKYPAEQFDTTWCEWNGSYSGWPAGFARPGRIYPEVGHTYQSLVHIPGWAHGNTHGALLDVSEPTGNASGSDMVTGHFFDLDTMRFERTANRRPRTGSAAGGACFDATTGKVFAMLHSSSTTKGDLFVYDPPTRLWVTRTATAPIDLPIEHGGLRSHPSGLLLNFCPERVTGVPAYDGVRHRVYAVSAAAAAAGAHTWQVLNVSATSWPLRFDNTIGSIGWCPCPLNGKLYAVNGRDGSTTLWEMSPPAGAVTLSDYLTGTWTVSTRTLAQPIVNKNVGGIGGVGAGSFFINNRLCWDDVSQCLMWTQDWNRGQVQAIRPDLGI